MDEIEIIDFGQIASDTYQHDVEGGDADWASVGRGLRNSFEKIGFAYIKNHGIPQHLIDKSHQVGEDFFNLPEETKVKYSQVVGYKQGYVEMSREILNEELGKEYREGFDIIDKNGTLPSEVEDFADTVKNLIDSAINLSMKILKCLEIALALNDIEEVDEEWSRVGRDLRNSFEKIGFAYIKNHGIPQELIDKTHEVAADFFNLPKDVKVKYSQVVGYKQGYVEMNREILNENMGREFREGFDIIDKNGTLPSEVEDFADTVKNLIDSSLAITQKILKCLEIALDLPKGTLLNNHKKLFVNTDENMSQFRILHYPPIPDTAKAGDTRLGEHSDYGTFTLLYQDSMKGLEALNRQEKWVEATPIYGTILVNVGDYLEMITGGKMVATKHRVRIPEEEAIKRCPRRSVVFFVGPENDTIWEPLEGTAPDPKITFLDYIQNRFQKAYQY